MNPNLDSAKSFRDVRSFAPVVPLNIARVLKNFNMLGDYHLLLAHDVLDNPTAYKEVYAPLNGAPLNITMDNSLIELGYPLRIREVIEAARVVNATKVVLPDVLGSLDETLPLVYQAREDFFALPKDITVGIKMVAVVQGNSVEECFKCLSTYSGLGLEISIPRVLVNILGSRQGIIQAAYGMGFRNMHLLGFSDNLIDDVASTRMYGVRGIDSTVPIRAGFKHMSLSLDSESFSERLGSRGDFWNFDIEQVTYNQMNTAMENIAVFKNWINR